MDINKSNNMQTLQLRPFELSDMQTAILPETEMTATISHNKRPLIVVQHNCLGHVEAPEGCRLMANLLDQFVELEALPTAVILQGRGVDLATADNPAQAALLRYITLSVPVLICEKSVEILQTVCQLEGSQLVDQREIAKQMIINPDIIWL